MNKAELVTFCF